MEKTRRAAVVPIDAGWSDVGSWGALHEVLDKDHGGNFTSGPVIAEACSGSYIAATSRTVAAYGLSDIVVVETDDAVLVVGRDDSQGVKKLAAQVGKGRAPGAARK
jgi:mannose-1-phosphate guanylyltransferase/mannose-6-phosphate isomerase